MMRREIRFEGSRLDRFLGKHFGALLFGSMFGLLGFFCGTPGGIVGQLMTGGAFTIVFGGMGALSDAVNF